MIDGYSLGTKVIRWVSLFTSILLAVGCGSESDSQTTTPTSPPETSTATPTPTTAPEDPLRPPDAATGDPGTDGVVAALTAFDGDPSALRELIRYTETECTLAEGAGGRPKCWSVPGAEQVEGAPVVVFPFSVCEAEWGPVGDGVQQVLQLLLPADPDGTASSERLSIYGIYAVPAVAEPSDWPAGEYAVVVARPTAGGLAGSVVRVSDGAIVSIEFGCGARHPALLSASFSSLLEPPLGGLRLDGEVIVAEVVEFPLSAVEETEPRWIAAVELAEASSGYRAVLIDGSSELRGPDGEEVAVDALRAGARIAVSGIPLPWSFWRAERVQVIDPGPPPEVAEWESFTSRQFGVSFQYPSAPDGYLLREIRQPEAELKVAWALARKSVIEASEPNSFGPRGITIEVFEPSTRPQSPSTWVRESPRSNLEMGPRTLSETEVSGLAAVRYQWTGLYRAETVVLQRGAEIWMFTATYRNDYSEIEADFDALLNLAVLAPAE